MNTRNEKQNKGQQNNNVNYKQNTTKQLDSIYTKLKGKISLRQELQEQQKRIWDGIEYGYNDKRELDDIDNRIGQATHMINVYIGQLSKIKYSHKAMNIAYDYLTNEIDRIGKIISSWNVEIHNVSRHYYKTMNERGHYSYNINGMREYVSKKHKQIARLKSWREHISKYRTEY